MKKTEEQVFLEVKERLDYYRLPTIFPFEALDLLSQILTLLDKQAVQGKENKSINIQKVENQINDALRLEIGKVVKENNKLHMDIHVAQQQIMSLKHNNDKLAIQRTGGNKEIQLLLKMQKRRQDEIFEELTQVKYKYNELMDLIHEDSEIQRRYIKRLMKHRRLEVNQRNQEPLLKESKKGQHQTVTDLEAKIKFIHTKLSNREAQILRLQKKIEYDGLNMNKILKDFQNHRTNNKIEALEQQINYLESENKKMKAEVNDVRKKGGAKEALRQEVRKNHDTINKLAQGNKELNRKLKQKTFDEEAKSKQGKREVIKAKKIAESKQQQNERANEEIADLLKKVEFLTSQLEATKQLVAQQQKRNDANDILITKMKNAEEGDRILAQYQVQSLKQKSEELQSQLQNYVERINQLKSQNEYHKQEDRLKNQAIENLEKIVDQLMKRNNQKGAQSNNLEFQTVSLENTIALRKNLAEMKQHLAMTQNDKQKLERQLENLLIRFDHKCQQNAVLIDQVKTTKMKVLQMKSNQEQFFVLQREVVSLQSDLKKQQNFRYKIDQLHQQAENDKTRLRKQLQQVTQQFEIYEKKSKNQINTLKLQFNEIQQSNQMLELISKQKDKKVVVLQEHIEELSGKIKLLKEQIAVVEQQKVNAIRERIKIEKRYEQLSRVNHENASLTKNIQDIESREIHNQVIQYQKEIKKLHERIVAQNEQLAQLNAYCDTLKVDQENLLIENNKLKEEVILFKNKEKKLQQYSRFD